MLVRLLRRPPPALSCWFAWLDDEDVYAGKPATKVRRPRPHPVPQPWLNCNQLTDVLAGAGDEGGMLDAVCTGRADGPLLRGQWRRPLQPHNARAVVRRLFRIDAEEAVVPVIRALGCPAQP